MTTRPRVLDWQAVLAAFLAMILVPVALAGPVAAATPGLVSTVLLNWQTYNGTDVVNEGDEIILRTQYNTGVAPGSTAVFELGPNVSLTTPPTANSAIESVDHDGNRVSITFKSPWPAGIDQGVFDLKFTVKPVDFSQPSQITWKIDGVETSIPVIIRDSGDQFAGVTENYAKSASPGNLDSFVTVSGGVVSVKPGLADQPITYTLKVDSPQARVLPLADQLPAGLAYVPGSFTGQLTTWDANGLNRTTNPYAFAPTIAGNAFTSSLDLPGPSQLTLTYQAKVTDLAALEAALQAKYDALGGGTGNFEIQLTNTATFGTLTKTASVRLRGTVPGVNVGNAFAKTADWSLRNVTTDETGTLTPPADITYRLKADLRQWTGAPNFTLTRNVVITDVLPDQATWNITDPDFLTATGITLTPAGTCPTDLAGFAADEFVGQYCLSGQQLWINVGKDSATNASIAVKAQIHTTAGLPLAAADQTSIVGATPYRLRNTAAFHYRTGTPHSVNRDATLVVLPDVSEGINDPRTFTKNGSIRDTSINPGETAVVDYTFTVGAGKGVDVRTSRLVDHIDASIFDISDLTTVVVRGSYDGQPMNASHFDLSTDTDGNLIVETSAAGDALVTLRGIDKRYEVTITLETLPFDGKVTKEIRNKATLVGVGNTPLYWSETGGEATSYGDEAEVRKRVYDRTSGEWVDAVRAHMDGTGQLLETTYVYRIEFLPRGSFDNVTITPVIDVLPDAVDFLGFVDEADAATGANATMSTVDIGGNLIADYDAATGTVTLSQKPGTRLDASGPIAAYLAVDVTDPAAPIVNRINDTTAEITPIRSVSVGDYVWVDTNRDGRQDDASVEPGIPGVTLILEGPDGQSVTDVFGQPVTPVVTGPAGEYTFDHLPALTGDETYTVRIDQDASADALAPYVPTLVEQGDRDLDSSLWEAVTVPGDLHDDGDRDPTLDFGFVLPSVSVGDYVWVDTNRDGRQGDASVEPGIPGVTLVLTGPDGQPVTDVFGQPVTPVVTGPEGEYTFDHLPALTGDETYTVRIDQDASADALAPYVPTLVEQGDREFDSSLWEAVTVPGDLHDDGDRDPTLDFGFVTKTYAIGDIVWIDANKNGLQDGGEDVLADVTVDLLDADGAILATTVTDDEGRYLFDNLAAGTYQVRFTLTDAQKAIYTFTRLDSGTNDAIDSDADPATGLTVTIVLDDSNTALTHDYDRPFDATQGVDPTWDAGVIVKPVPVIVDAGEKVTGALPTTGSAISLTALAIALMMVITGGLLIRRSRITS